MLSRFPSKNADVMIHELLMLMTAFLGQKCFLNIKIPLSKKMYSLAVSIRNLPIDNSRFKIIIS